MDATVLGFEIILGLAFLFFTPMGWILMFCCVMMLVCFSNSGSRARHAAQMHDEREADRALLHAFLVAQTSAAQGRSANKLEPADLDIPQIGTDASKSDPHRIYS